MKSEKNTKNLLEDSKNQVNMLQDQLQASASHVQRLEEEQKKMTEQLSALAEQKRVVELENEKLNGDIKSHQVTASGDTVSKSELMELQQR